MHNNIDAEFRRAAPRSSAQEVPNFVASNSGEFRTDRPLAATDQDMERDSQDRACARCLLHPMHPTLYGLWCTVEQSDLLVIVEFDHRQEEMQ